MRIFVLTTGRSGSVTMSKALACLDGFTVGHETRAHLFGDDRFNYPEDHIEIDPRLVWFLGGLAKRFDDEDTLYVHLTRCRSDVVRSYAHRFNAVGAGFIQAFGNGILRGQQEDRIRQGQQHDVADLMVDTIRNNIQEFLRGGIGRQRVKIELENPKQGLSELLGRLDQRNKFGRIRDAMRQRHNATVSHADLR